MHFPNSSPFRHAALLSAVGLMAACSSETNGPVNFPTSNLIGDPVPATTLDTAQVKICKFGSAGTFTVTIDGTASQVSLQDGDCQVVGNIPPLATGPHSFTVAENSDPATVFDSLEVFRTVDKTTIVYQTSSTTPSFSGTFNGDVGRLVEFFNHPAPPPPPPGCTVTLGFWKNHLSDWPSGFDPNAAFGSSGKSWIGVLKTSPVGNAYYILAHQYIAAVLNGASGASAPANVQAAISGAAAYFAANSPTPAPSGALRTQLITWATLLDNYNNGLVGPGHCVDDTPPVDQ
jgi:hypothetical protein